ncbi:MAG: DUF3291 domain-containing protein [Verrucomicrobia bacterium]|nr:DUF3291 domain-containing protein [Verrucomicrobiota bacterium]
MEFHLAQVNIAKAKGPIDGPVMAEFVQALDEINRLAESSPGFVWRYQTEAGHAIDFQPFADPLILFNMSVWDSVANLKAYVYRSMHGQFFARRQQWFEPLSTPHMALWWIPAGTLPTPEDAKAAMERLEREGETVGAFTFRKLFPAPVKET